MKMHLLSGGRLRLRKSIYFPDANRSETMDVPVSCALLRHRHGNVLFDTGCHPSVPDDPKARWGDLAKIMAPIMPKGDNVVTGLAGIGLQCDDIDIVVCSHLHPDHCGCNTLFKRASFIIHKKEIEAARGPDAKNAGYLAGEWERSAPTEELDGERDLFGDGRIVLIPLPGHTPGTTGALVAPACLRLRGRARHARLRHHPTQYLERRRTRQIARRNQAPPAAGRHRTMRP